MLRACSAPDRPQSEVSDRAIAWLAFAANLLFWPLMFAMAALRPNYSHLHQAISELGSYGAPRMWLWNVLGYIIPGILLAVFGWCFVRRIRPRSLIAAGLLALAGVFLAVSGAFPADMADRAGPATRLHLVGLMGSALAWLPAMIVVAVLAWRPRRDVAIACVVALLAMVGAFGLYGVMPETPALVQRISFGVFFGWYLAAALLLLKPGSRLPPG